MCIVLSFDIGTTSIKAGIISSEGILLKESRTELEVIRNESAAAEHDTNQLWSTIIRLGKEVLEGRADQVELIAFSSYQFGVIFLDKDFKPLTCMSTLMDTRARRTFEDFSKSLDLSKVYEQTGCPPFFQYCLARLYYFSKHKPELFKEATYMASSKAFLMHKFTGELVSDAGTESASQYFNIESKTWMRDLLKPLGADHIKLPEISHPINDSFKILPEVARELGLREEVKVLTSVYDGAAVGLGLGGFAPNRGVINIGTSGMLRVLVDKFIVDDSSKMRFQTYCLFDNLYLPGAGINNATLPLRWLKDNILYLDGYDKILDAVEHVPAGSDGLFCLPYLTGERDWQRGTTATGMFFGLRERHKREHIVKSCLEGVAYCLALVDQALSECGMNPQVLRIGGGGTKIHAWLEIIASCLNKPLERTDVADSCLIGNAMLSFVHLKEFPDLATASEKLVEVKERIEPNPELVDIYAKLFSFYKDIYSDVDSLYKRLYRLCQDMRK